MKRNGYVDVIKFIFALIIAEFHLNTGLFPGGRVAVDGFFMISAYLMMRSLERSTAAEETGVSTVKFLFRKYQGLIYPLLASVLIAFVVDNIAKGYPTETVLTRLPLLFFELFPLHTAGFPGTYVVGISWYLSSMFLALAILYPLIKRFRTGVTLTVCPLLFLLGYGLLAGKYGHLAVGGFFLKDSILHTGIIRALAGSSAGCLLYEICRRIENKQFTPLAQTVFTLSELLLLVGTFALMHHFPGSRFEYLAVFLLFALLLIGIGRLSVSSHLWNPKWTKFFGTASTLIVLNHVPWTILIREKLAELDTATKILFYVVAVALTCLAAYALSRLFAFLFGKLFQKKLWVKDVSEGKEK